MQFWNELEGQVIEGYPLRRLVRSEGRTAWFGSTGAHNEPITVSLTESLTDADEVTERLEAAQQLKDPNLIAISKVGRTRIGETLVVYAIMEHADQDLADILRSQPLSKEEARQVAEALVEGLMAIHKRDLVHGRVEAASVLAVGDSVKLRSDCLQSPGGTRAGDVAGIGTILFQAFTQRKAPAADDAQINRIPAPFAEIVRNSLSARWGLAQIASVLKPAALPSTPAVPPSSASVSTPAVSAPAVPAAPAAAASVTVTPPQTAPVERPVTRPVPPAPAIPAAGAVRTPIIDDEDNAEEESGSRRRYPLGLFATLGMALLVLVAWFLFRPKAKSPVPPSPAAATQSAAPESSSHAALPPALPGAPAATTGGIAPSGRAKPSAAKPVAAPGTPARPVWRVVAYTYVHRDQAQHKADDINQAHPGLAASVYPVNHNRGPFLVTLGGPMDRSQALKLRAQAISLGMAPDSYAQNFPH